MVLSVQKKPFLSVILPVYNVEQYLPQCLDSILEQSMQDFELICVNDGSTDNSLAILEEYAKKSDKIQIITIANSGVGGARNVAMSVATGKFLVIIDSDDYIQPEYFMSIYDVAKGTAEIDVMQFDFKSFEDGSNEMVYGVSAITDSFAPYEVFEWKHRCPHTLKGFRMVVWNKVYRLAFLKKYDLQFPTYRVGEDNIFSILTVVLSAQFTYIPQAFYCYRVRKGSASNKVSVKYVETIDLIKYCNNMMIRFPLLRQYKEELYQGFVGTLKYGYYRLPEELRAQYLLDAKSVLPIEHYKKLLKTARSTDPWYTWICSASKKWLDCDGKLSKF